MHTTWLWYVISRDMMRNRSIFFFFLCKIWCTSDLPFIGMYHWNNNRSYWFSIEHGLAWFIVCSMEHNENGWCEIAAIDRTRQQYKLYRESFVPNLIIFVFSISEIIYSFSRWKLSRILIEFPWHFLIREINQHSLHFIQCICCRLFNKTQILSRAYNI